MSFTGKQSKIPCMSTCDTVENKTVSKQGKKSLHQMQRQKQSIKNYEQSRSLSSTERR